MMIRCNYPPCCNTLQLDWTFLLKVLFQPTWSVCGRCRCFETRSGFIRRSHPKYADIETTPCAGAHGLRDQWRLPIVVTLFVALSTNFRMRNRQHLYMGENHNAKIEPPKRYRWYLRHRSSFKPAVILCFNKIKRYKRKDKTWRTERQQQKKRIHFSNTESYVPARI